MSSYRERMIDPHSGVVVHSTSQPPQPWLQDVAAFTSRLQAGSALVVSDRNADLAIGLHLRQPEPYMRDLALLEEVVSGSQSAFDELRRLDPPVANSFAIGLRHSKGVRIMSYVQE